MEPSRTVVITDASHRTGFGHLRRCLTLCEALARRGGTSRFVLGESDAAARAWLRKQERPFHCVPLSSPAKVASLCLKHRADVVVVDTYRSNAALLDRLLAGGLRVLVIDDLADRPLPSTWLTNSAISSGSRVYRRLTEGRLLLGPRYALLRRGFAGSRPRGVMDCARKVLVAVGGSDVRGLTPAVLKALSLNGERLHVRAVLGPLSNPVSGPGSRGHCRIEILRDVRNMARLMRWADVAIAGGGQTLFELAAAGCPCVAICVAPNQEVTTALFRRIGSAVVERTADDAVCRAFQLLESPARRQTMSRLGRRAVDGMGADRVAAVLCGERR